VIEYVVFSLLFAAGIVFYILHEIRIRKTGKVKEDLVRKPDSPIEWRLYSALMVRGERVEPQVSCGRYRIDLVLRAYRIAIECDGKAYHSTPEQKAHDRRKNTYLRKNGWKVLRFSGSAINGRMGKVLEKIEKEKFR
jgi:very-short-patch-repair endonuclease